MSHVLTIPDDTYQALLVQAAARNLAVDELIRRAVEALPHPTGEPGGQTPETNGHPTTTPGDLSYPEWKRVFDGLVAQAQSRAGRYPPGFQADVSREAMYEGCGE